MQFENNSEWKTNHLQLLSNKSEKIQNVLVYV